MKESRTIRQLRNIALWAVLAAAPAVFGADANPTVTKATAVAPKVPGKERVAKISLTEITAIGAHKGWFQEEYAKINARPELVNITQLSTVLGAEASLLDRGDLHITSRMAYPAAQHRANGLDAVIIWQSVNAHPRRATIPVLASTDIRSVADLVGKKFGSSTIGCPYYAGVEAIKVAGHSVDTEAEKGDIRFVNITGVAGTSAFLAGRIDALGTHPGTSATAPLYIQNQVREVATAVPDGAYVTAGGRTAYFAMRKWALENPDLVKAFLLGYDRTIRWLNSDNGAHWDEAAQIAARETREPKSVALYDLQDVSRISWSWGQPDYQEAVDSIKKFQQYAISIKDPFFTKHHLSDKQIETFVDKRFFAGGEYFVDTSEHPQKSTQTQTSLPVDAKAGVQLAQASDLK
jgi:sulfonate transport system substrate-binding protein